MTIELSHEKMFPSLQGGQSSPASNDPVEALSDTGPLDFRVRSCEIRLVTLDTAVYS